MTISSSNLGAAVTMAIMMYASISQASDTPPDHYLCTTDYEIGFGFDKSSSKWVPERFSAGTKYIVRPIRDGEHDAPWAPPDLRKTNWAVVQVGENTPISACGTDDWPAVAPYGPEIRCHGPYDFAMQIDNLRFMISTPAQFLQPIGPENEKSDNPVSAIGKCSAIGSSRKTP